MKYISLPVGPNSFASHAVYRIRKWQKVNKIEAVYIDGSTHLDRNILCDANSASTELWKSRALNYSFRPKQFIRTKIEQLPQNSKPLVKFLPIPTSTFAIHIPHLFIYSVYMLNIYFIPIKMEWTRFSLPEFICGAMSRDIFRLWKMQMADKWGQANARVAWCLKYTEFSLSNNLCDRKGLQRLQILTKCNSNLHTKYTHSRATFRDSFIHSLQWRFAVLFFFFAAPNSNDKLNCSICS